MSGQTEHTSTDGSHACPPPERRQHRRRRRYGAVVSVLQRFWSVRRAAVAVETVVGMTFTLGIVGGVAEIVSTVFHDDLLSRAAYAVAKDNALHQRPASDEAALLERAHAAIRYELGSNADPELLNIDITVYDNPSDMLDGTVSTGPNSLLGGDPGNLVVVRVGLKSATPIERLRNGFDSEEPQGPVYRALAVARNERLTELPAQEETP